MSSSSPSDYTTTWRDLPSTIRAKFTSAGIQLPESVSNEPSFRNEVRKLCEAEGLEDCTQLLGKLHWDHVIAFVKAIETGEDHMSKLSLASYVWRCAFAAIKTTCDAGVELDNAVRLIGMLNSGFPRVSGAIRRASHHNNIHDPLQEMFTIYTNTLLYVATQLRKYHNGALDNFEWYIDQRSQDLMAVEARFLEIFGGATEAERLDVQQQQPQDFVSSKDFDEGYRVNYKRNKTLGSGSAGTKVIKVIETLSGSTYARKAILRNGDEQQRRLTKARVDNEVKIMRKLVHIHIASVSYYHPLPDSYNIFMTPAADDNLRTFLYKCREQEYETTMLQQLIPWFGCLLYALKFMHALEVNHRDIKPSNILVHERNVLLADFGEAKDFSDPESYIAGSTSGYRLYGTPDYRAPEVAQDEPRGYPADVFSLGCVFSEMLTVFCERTLEAYEQYRRNAIEEEDLHAYHKNLSKVRDWLEQLSCRAEVLKPARSVIERMIKEKSEERSTAQELYDDLRMEDSTVKFYCDLH